MRRALLLATLLAVVCGAAAGQALAVLHIKVTLTDAAGASIPIARHALLISDNPSTTSPRRVVTKADGTADVSLPPGNYTVESDEPLAFSGTRYQWTQTLDVRAGPVVVLELTARNVEIAAASATPPAAAAASLENDPSLLLPQWKDSIVSVWTPASRGSGFIVSSQGLVVTNQRLVGSATAVEVQLTPALKVGARVLVADRARDVAVLWIDPGTAATVRPVPLNCGAKAPPITDTQKLAAFGAPRRGEKDWTFADASTFRLDPGSSGGPVFDATGAVAGLSSLVDEKDEVRRRDRHAHIVPVGNACEAVMSSEQAIQTAPRPVATHLPTEPLTPFADGVLDAEVTRRAGNLNPYQMTTADFDVAFFTPVQVKGAKNPDFGEWTDYFADNPPVLLVRVTPKMAESFWATLARGAAYTQGAALPPITHFKPGFSRLRVLCGDAEVTPIHPFVIERRLSDTEGAREGLYVFEPKAIGPHCASVTLVLSSEKAPARPDTRTVDPKVIERIGQDFTLYRP